MNNFRVTEVTRRSLSVAWTKSVSAQRVRITISPAPTDGSPAEVPNASAPIDGVHTFQNLTPNTVYTLKACAASAEEISLGEESCRPEIRTQTIPQMPLEIASLAALPQTNATTQTIRFTHNNPIVSAATSYSVRLFLDGAPSMLRETIVTARVGAQTHDVTFENLQPFTAYEVWVSARNNQGAPEATGLSFTTVNPVTLTAQPLSGRAAMLMFDADAYGSYTVYRRNTDGTADELTSLLVGTPGPQRLVLEEMAGSQRIFVTWQVAHLTSRSSEVVVQRGPSGAPELVSASVAPLFPFGNSLPLRGSASFVPTISDSGKVNASYALVVEAFGGGANTLATNSTLPFIKGEAESMSGTASFLFRSPRVCRRVTSSTGVVTQACSAGPEFATQGLARVQ